VKNETAGKVAEVRIPAKPSKRRALAAEEGERSLDLGR
jgi:hypothetical protein